MIINQNRKELPIVLDIDLTVDLVHALPLCIITTQDNFKNWLFQNYMSPIIYFKGLNHNNI